MEIFKAAAQVDNAAVTMNTKPAYNAQTREVEQTKIQQDSVALNGQNDQKEQLSTEQIQDMLDQANKNMSLLNTNIRFGYNDKISSMYVNVMEADTGTIIRKIPTEQVMKLTEHFRDIVGMIFDKKE